MARLYTLDQLCEGDLCVRAYLLEYSDPYQPSPNVVLRKGLGGFLGPYNSEKPHSYISWGEGCRFFKVEKVYSSEVKPTDFFVFVPRSLGPIQIKLETLHVKMIDNRAMDFNNIDLGPCIKDLSGTEWVISLGQIYFIKPVLTIRSSASLEND